MNKSKVKGSGFEHTATLILNSLIEDADFRRVPGSGAIGTVLGEPLLSSDLRGEVKRFPKKFRVECKTGYSNRKGKEAKSFSLQKEWLDKIKKEADGSFSFPFLIGHFDGARSGVKNFVVLDVEDYAKLINMYIDLVKELEKR